MDPATTGNMLFGAQMGLNLLQARENLRGFRSQLETSAFQAAITEQRAVQQGAFAREGLQIGAERSILGSILSAEQTQTAAARRTEFTGPLERASIRRSAEFEERSRRSELAQAIGAQRATFASFGVAGGRTKRLSLARSQSEFAREQLLRTQRTRQSILVSTERDRAAQLSADRARTASEFEQQAARQDLRRGITASFMQQGAAIEDAQLQLESAQSQARQTFRQQRLNILGQTLNTASNILTMGS